jgi:hypothetical protein
MVFLAVHTLFPESLARQCRKQIPVRCGTLFKALRYGVDKENKVKRLRDIPVDIKLGTQQRRH